MELRRGIIAASDLELRRAANGGHRLKGRFPYGSVAVLSDGGRAGGRPVKEMFAKGAFGYRLGLPPDEGDIHLLAGHDYGKPLASRKTGTLDFRDTPDALELTAEITPAIAATSHGADVLALLAAGLAVGLSPGFRIPPPRAVPADQAERITQEAYEPAKGNFGAVIRTILQALLYEFSIVTKPAYADATVEPDDGSDEDDDQDQRSAGGVLLPHHHLARWRL